MLLDADAEALDGNALRDGEHQRRARRHLPELVASRGHDPDAVDVRPARVDHEVDAFFLEKTESLRDDLAELVSAGEPAELHIEHGEPVDGLARTETGAERERARSRESVPEKGSSIALQGAEA